MEVSETEFRDTRNHGGAMATTTATRATPSRTSPATRRRVVVALGMTRAVRARIPPSPWFSARMTSARYLIEMMTIRAQNAIDATPRALVSSTGRSWCSNASRKA